MQGHEKEIRFACERHDGEGGVPDIEDGVTPVDGAGEGGARFPGRESEPIRQDHHRIEVTMRLEVVTYPEPGANTVRPP